VRKEKLFGKGHCIKVPQDEYNNIAAKEGLGNSMNEKKFGKKNQILFEPRGKNDQRPHPLKIRKRPALLDAVPKKEKDNTFERSGFDKKSGDSGVKGVFQSEKKKQREITGKGKKGAKGSILGRVNEG